MLRSFKRIKFLERLQGYLWDLINNRAIPFSTNIIIFAIITIVIIFQRKQLSLLFFVGYFFKKKSLIFSLVKQFLSNISYQNQSTSENFIHIFANKFHIKLIRFYCFLQIHSNRESHVFTYCYHYLFSSIPIRFLIIFIDQKLILKSNIYYYKIIWKIFDIFQLKMLRFRLKNFNLLWNIKWKIPWLLVDSFFFHLRLFYRI